MIELHDHHSDGVSRQIYDVFQAWPRKPINAGLAGKRTLAARSRRNGGRNPAGIGSLSKVRVSRRSQFRRSELKTECVVRKSAPIDWQLPVQSVRTRHLAS